MEIRNNPKCHICGVPADYFMHKEEFALYKCLQCKLVFVFPMLGDEYLRSEVYSAKSGYQGNRKGDLTNEPLPARFASVLDYLGEGSRSKKILDVGASNGLFLYYAKKRGLETYGVEINPKTANAGLRAGLNIFIGFLNEAKFQDNFFDYIHLGDVIEHVTEPADLIRECRRILKPGGSIIIRTPNLDCFWSDITLLMYRIFGIPWSSATPPHHLFQFTENNLGLLMDKNGFAAKKYWYERPPALMYELGGLHLMRKYKKSRKFKDLVFAFFAYGLYTVLYAIDILVAPFKRKDNSMTGVFAKI